MNTKWIVIIALLGIVTGFTSIYFYNGRNTPKEPIVIDYDPYDNGIYASGILENVEPNVDIYAEISGRVTHVAVAVGEPVKKDEKILTIDPAEQEAIVARDLSALLHDNETLLNAQDQLKKLQNETSDSKNTDRAVEFVNVATKALNVSQARYNANKSLLDRTDIKSPLDGVILRVPTVGEYVSVNGANKGHDKVPIVQIGVPSSYMVVRCFVNELLVPDLPAGKLEAMLFFKGGNYQGLPLEYMRTEPFIISNNAVLNEKTGTRVLPILFKFQRPLNYSIYPGQSVDVYIKPQG